MVLVQITPLQVMTGREEEFYIEALTQTLQKNSVSQSGGQLEVVSERGLSRSVTVTEGSGIVPGKLLYQDWSYPGISTVP